MPIEIKYYSDEGELLHDNADHICSLANKRVILTASDDMSWPDVLVLFVRNLPAFGYSINKDVLDKLTDAIYNKGECDGFITKEDYLADIDAHLDTQKEIYEAKIDDLETQLRAAKRKKGK